MKVSPLLGLLGLIIGQVASSALAADATQDSLADLFSMAGRDMITTPQHLGIVNGKLTLGTPGGQAACMDGLWAPPYVSSDFALRVEIFGKVVPAPVVTWWPYKIEQQGRVDGVEVSAATVLVAGQRAVLVSIALRNTTANALEVPVGFRTSGTLDYRAVWGFAPPQKSSTATSHLTENATLALTAGELSICLRGNGDALKWDAIGKVGTQLVALRAGGTATVYLAVAIGPSAAAAAACRVIAADPAKAIADAGAAHRQAVAELFARIPRLVSDNKEVEKFYNRSLVHFIMNRWDVPEFVLHPYYSTGSIRGGCVTEYLWNYGESWQMMPLCDPAANREHIKQFLKCDMTKANSFDPISGTAGGTWYPVNDEKTIGLVYHHVRLTGDTAFLDEVVDGKTVLDYVLKSALFGDDVSKPVKLIDYGPRGDHLELRRNYPYNHVMPDLNGRRYANYLHAARLADFAGKPAPQLRERASSLKTLLKDRLWNPQTHWFNFLDGNGQPATRWTVQMFYLLGSGVLDNETEDGLVSHLNTKEFLGDYGLHSLALGDPAYDPADVDNGGPGACTCFPPNIAILLYQAGRQHEAEDLLRRCIWWGSRMPYWGDSICADRMDYRHDTPLQCTIDGLAVAQCFIFGMFGVDPQFDGSIRVSPRPAAFAPDAALRGVRIRDSVFDIELGDKQFKVLSGGKSIVAPMGGTVSIKKSGMSIIPLKS